MSLATLGILTNGMLQLHPDLTIRSLDDKPLCAEPLPENLIIDGSAVAYADSIGIAALIWLAGLSVEQSRVLTWQNLPCFVQELLQLYEIDLQGMMHICKKN
ncbi:MAG: STAS domain-containing protein [Cardiobacteriaceae bacterium]|nr:STAS domain-containing protein [Cardiobacteriaceae bacterium]